jgi:CheY-like chemotaxis protein
MSVVPIVLLVDDEDAYRQAAKEWIEKGYPKLYGGMKPTVLPVATIAAAEDILRQRPSGVDVIVTDADLPGRNGFDLARLVGGGLPLVMISARDPAMFKDQAKGISPPPVFLPKPTSLRNAGPLLEQIHDWLWYKAIQDASRAADLPPADTAPLAELPPSPRGATGRNLSLSRERAAILAVHVDMGEVPAGNPLPPDGMDFGYAHQYAAVFHVAVHEAAGEPLVLIGQFLVAAFPDGEAADGVRRAIRALLAFRDRMQRVLPSVGRVPQFAAGVAAGPCSVGRFGGGLLGTPAVVGRVPDVAVQLAAIAHIGRLAFVRPWLSATELAEIVAAFLGEPATRPTRIVGEQTITEVGVG